MMQENYKELFEELSKEQIQFICNEFNLSEEELRSMSCDELDDIYDEIGSIEVDETLIADDNTDPFYRVHMAVGITLAKNCSQIENETNEANFVQKQKSLIPFLLFIVLISFIAVVAGYSLGWIIDAYEVEGDRVEVLFRNTATTISIWVIYLLADVIRQWWEAKQRIC